MHTLELDFEFHPQACAPSLLVRRVRHIPPLYFLSPRLPPHVSPHVPSSPSRPPSPSPCIVLILWSHTSPQASISATHSIRIRSSKPARRNAWRSTCRQASPSSLSISTSTATPFCRCPRDLSSPNCSPQLLLPAAPRNSSSVAAPLTSELPPPSPRLFPLVVPLRAPRGPADHSQSPIEPHRRDGAQGPHRRPQSPRIRSACPPQSQWESD